MHGPEICGRICGGSWKVCVRWHFVETGPGLFSILLSLVFFFFGEVLSLVLTLGNIEG